MSIANIQNELTLAQLSPSGQILNIFGTGATKGWGVTADVAGLAASVGWAPGAQWLDATTGLWYINIGTAASANFVLQNSGQALVSTGSFWQRFGAVPNLGGVLIGGDSIAWATASTGTLVTGPTDGAFAYFNMPIQLLPGTIITNIEIKSSGSATGAGAILELVKRVDSTNSATAWTSVATATGTTGTGISVVTATAFAETVLETTSYALRASGVRSSLTPTINVYSLGIQTSKRVL